MRTSTSNYERLTLFALISLCPPAPRKLKWLYSEEHFGTNSPYPVIVFCLRSSKVGSNNITRRQNVLLTSLSRLLHSEYSSGAVGFLLQWPLCRHFPGEACGARRSSENGTIERRGLPFVRKWEVSAGGAAYCRLGCRCSKSSKNWEA